MFALTLACAIVATLPMRAHGEPRYTRVLEAPFKDTTNRRRRLRTAWASRSAFQQRFEPGAVSG
jgi:hypothetical protein